LIDPFSSRSAFSSVGGSIYYYNLPKEDLYGIRQLADKGIALLSNKIPKISDNAEIV